MSRFINGLVIDLAAFRLKREGDWPHPLLWDDRDLALITKSLASQLGYRPELRPKITAIQFLAQKLALVGLHEVERDLDGTPTLSPSGAVLPVGDDDELKLAIWRAATVGDDDSEELRKAVLSALLKPGREWRWLTSA